MPLEWSRALLALLLAGPCGGCAGEPTAPRAPAPVSPPLEASAVDESALCAAVAGRFVGLPDLGFGDDPKVPRPSVGRWWIRGCTAEPQGELISIRLRGPGWYWVDRAGSGVRVEEQVPFELKLALRGSLHLESSPRVLGLWLSPSREPDVEVRGPATLAIHNENAWGALLRLMPGLDLQKMAARRVESALAASFRSTLSEGATFTVDLRTGQTDAALGRFRPGQKPLHPFSEDEEWLVNERLRLPRGATQVLGPMPPGPSALDVIIEHGPGIVYRALCDSALEARFSSIANGNFSSPLDETQGVEGELHGLGERTRRLGLSSCKYYLVVATRGDETTIASIRVRAAGA